MRKRSRSEKVRYVRLQHTHRIGGHEHFVPHGSGGMPLHEEGRLLRNLAHPIVAVSTSAILVGILEVLVLLHRRSDPKAAQFKNLILLNLKLELLLQCFVAQFLPPAQELVLLDSGLAFFL